jgi:hypothetical protein
VNAPAGAPIAAYAVDQVFADIWTRPGLDRRSRSDKNYTGHRGLL